MTTVTIPKELMKEKELILIPRREYERLLAGRAVKQEIRVRRSPSFRVPKKHEKFYEKLDRDLTKAVRECEEGKCHGPFETVEEGRKFLESRAVFKFSEVRLPKDRSFAPLRMTEWNFPKSDFRNII